MHGYFDGDGVFRQEALPPSQAEKPADGRFRGRQGVAAPGEAPLGAGLGGLTEGRLGRKKTLVISGER